MEWSGKKPSFKHLFPLIFCTESDKLDLRYERSATKVGYISCLLRYKQLSLHCSNCSLYVSSSAILLSTIGIRRHISPIRSSAVRVQGAHSNSRNRSFATCWSVSPLVMHGEARCGRGCLCESSWRVFVTAHRRHVEMLSRRAI